MKNVNYVPFINPFSLNRMCSLFIAFVNILGIYLMGLFFMHKIIMQAYEERYFCKRIKRQQQNRLTKCPCLYEKYSLTHFLGARK